MVTVRRCSNCGHENVQSHPNKILGVEVNHQTKGLRLSEIIEKQFNTWSTTFLIYCPLCSNTCEHTEMTKIADAKNILLMQLGIWEIIGNTVVKKQPSIKNVPADVIQINRREYIVSSAIFHHGKGVSHGHYKDILRKDQKWVRTNDTIVEKVTWLRLSKDAYMFVCSANS